MYRCELCNTIVQKRNKTEHNQTKKRKYYSNLIFNRYVINNVEVIRFKDVFNPYFNHYYSKRTLYHLHYRITDTFLHRVISVYFSHRWSAKIIPKIEIVFISDPKDITRQHYLEQPKSLLCRKLIRRFHESTSQDFEYKWLPDSFKDL